MSRIDHKAMTPGEKGAYKSWMAMRQRCRNPNSNNYHLYGGAGVKIADRWDDFYAFLADMGERAEGMSLDRFPNNKGNYEPGNCRWATQKEQIENSEQRRGIEHLSPQDAADIRRRFAAGEHYKVLAEEYEVSQVTIHRAAKGDTFGNPPQLDSDGMASALAAINSLRRGL